MRHLLFAAVMCGGMAMRSDAQQVPARDLLDFPLGSIAEPAALSTQLSSGLWNPAAIIVPRTERVMIGIGALNSPIDQGVSEQVAAASIWVPRDAVLTLSVARAAVTDLVRTETDPESIDGEIPYSTTVYSAGLSRRFSDLTAGFALRMRSGTADYVQRSAGSIDFGVMADTVFGLPVRLAASTFLLSPQAKKERSTLLGAADIPVYHRGSDLEARAGLSASMSDGRGTEHYLYGVVRFLGFQVRGGMAQTNEFGATSNHLRLGMDLHYGRYAIGIAREQQGAGLGADYQFMLTSVFP